MTIVFDRETGFGPCWLPRIERGHYGRHVRPGHWETWHAVRLRRGRRYIALCYRRFGGSARALTRVSSGLLVRGYARNGMGG